MNLIKIQGYYLGLMAGIKSHKSWSGFMYERNGICQFAG